MNSILRFGAGKYVAICSVLLFPILSGCQDKMVGRTIVARLDDAVIDEAQLFDRMQHVTQESFQQTLTIAGRTADPTLDAGAVALISLMREAAIDQHARQMKVVPTEESVDKYFAYQLASDPQLDKQIKAGTVSEAIEKSHVRLNMEVYAIGTNGATVDPSELQSQFDQLKTSLNIPAKLGLRMLGVKNETEGQQIIMQLKASGDFKAAEQQEQMPYPFDGSERFFSIDGLQTGAKPLYDAVQSLNPGQITPAPVVLSVNTASGPRPLDVIAQVTQKFPAKTVTLDEVRPVLIERILTIRYPQMTHHFLEQLSEYLRSQSKNIEIDNDRYKAVVAAYLLAPPPPLPESAPATGQNPPSGSAGRPGSRSTQPGQNP